MNGIGKLYFRYGTMGSAKTAMLLTQAYNFEERGMQYLCMKPIIDDRENDNVIRSRIGIERKCSWIYPESDLYVMLKEMFDTTLVVKDWILIDEAQFLSAPQIDQLARIVDDYGVNVVCYGLRTDFQSHMFEGSRRLFELADTIEEIKSTCSCGRKTIINARIDAQGNGRDRRRRQVRLPVPPLLAQPPHREHQPQRHQVRGRIRHIKLRITPIKRIGIH